MTAGSVLVLGVVSNVIEFVLSNWLGSVGVGGLIVAVILGLVNRVFNDIVVKTFYRVVTAVGNLLVRGLNRIVQRYEGSEKRRHEVLVGLAEGLRDPIERFTRGTQDRLDELEERVERLEKEQPDPIEEAEETLHAQGFDWLSEEELENGQIDRQNCWRRPFTFAEIHADFALDRQRVAYGPDGEEEERVNVTEELTDALADGGEHIVIGRPGSGKTTVLKSVAVRWVEEDRGPVFYRRSGQRGRDVDADELREAIETILDDEKPEEADEEPDDSEETDEETDESEQVLVVVEDVMRPDAVSTLEVVEEYQGNEDRDVSILLDSRENEWQDAEGMQQQLATDPASSYARELKSTVETGIEVHQVPPLDEHEVERFVKKFEAVTSETVRQSASDILYGIWVEQKDELPVDDEVVEQLLDEGDLDAETLEPDVDGEEQVDVDTLRRRFHEQVVSQLELSLPGSVSLLMYHLPVEGAGDVGGESTTLRGNVKEVLQTIEAVGEDDSDEVAADLLHGTALLANVLNATEIGVHKELLYGLGWWHTNDGDSEPDFGAVEQCITALDGQVLFGEIDETASPEYWSHHALWSKLYLEEFIDRHDENGRDTARQWFERAVSALFAIPSDAERREAIQDQLGGPVGPFQEMDDHPTEYADYFVRTVFDLGTERPPVADLFATTEYSGIELPEVASGETKANVAFWRAEMGQLASEYESAWNEAEAFGKRIDRHCPDNDVLRGVYHRMRGILNTVQSNLEEAREEYETALRIQRDIDHRRGAAATLHNIGVVAFEQSDYEAARDHFENSLAIQREFGNRRGAAKSLIALGNVAAMQSDYKVAREYYEESRAITRELGDRRTTAQTLNNLGNVAYEQSDYDAAREYYEDSLTITRELGDRHTAAATLNNLGAVASEQSDYVAARDYYEDSLAISTDIGALSYSIQIYENLAGVCARQGDTEAAIEYCNRAIQTIDQAGIPALAEQRETFEQLRDGLQTAEKDPDERYELALGRVLANEGGTAMQMFHAVWDQREDVDETDEEFSSVLAGGVLYAAHLAFFGTDEDEEGGENSTHDPEDVLSEVEPHANELSTPVQALFEYLDEGEADTELDDLTEGIDEDVDNVEDLSRGDKEAITVTTLLGELQSRAELQELSTEECYTQALYAIGNDDTSYAIRLLLEAWSRRDKTAEDTDEYSAVLAAGTLLAAHDPLVDQEIPSSDILDAIEPHESRLSDPVAAVFQQLRYDDTDATPDELREEVDEDAEEPDKDDLEAVVCAGLLEQLTLDPEDVEEALGEMPLDECYERALSSIGEREIRGANALLREAWSRYDETAEDDEAYPTVLTAGTLLAAYGELLDLDVNGTEILETIEPHRNRLSEPVEAVFQQLHEGDTDVTPDELRETVDEDAEEFDLDDLETLIFADALATLQDDLEASDGEDQSVPSESDAGDTESTVDLDNGTTDLREDYRRGLTALITDDERDAVDALFDAWSHADDLPTDADAFPTAVAAGVAVMTLDSDTIVDAIRTEILDTADDHRTRLPASVTAVLATLDGTEPETTPNDLLADIDLDGDVAVDDLDASEFDVDDLELDDLETLAFARLLSRAEA